MRDRDIAAEDIGTLPGGLRILDPMGSTPEGTLYHAEHPSGLKVALLLAPPESSDASAARLARLERAIEIQHVNVARIYEAGALANGSVYAVLEKVAGEPLAATLAADTVFSLRDAVDLASQVAAGLQAAHRAGFVHGNLSPATILVSGPGGWGSQVKLIGFELDPTLRHAGVPLPLRPEAYAYASPERLDGQSPDDRSDIFSLGAVLHQLLTGEPPGSENGDRSVPRAARRVVATALASDPTRRFSSISEFEAALQRLAVRAAGGTARRIRRTVAAGALAAALVGLIMGGSRLLRNESSPGEDLAVLPAAPAPDRPPLRADSIARRDTVRAQRGPPVTRAPAARPKPEPRAAPSRAAPSRAAPSRAVPPPRAAPPRATPPRAGPAAGGATEGSATERVAAAGIAPARAARADSLTETGGAPVRAPDARAVEGRAGVYLRIGLDEARQQLGRPVHALEGMTPTLYGLALSGQPPFTDTTQPVVRSVYEGQNGDLILLDQQRVRPGVAVPVRSENILRLGNVILHLHGTARPEVLRNLVRRVR